MARGLPKTEEKEARQSRLQLAIANDDIDEVHNLIEEEPELLDRVSKQPFPNTPLHLAAAAGKTQVAMEIAILKPSFTRKLNSKGDSPMHLALQYEHYQTVRALMTLDPKLIRVRGRRGITPLHHIAEKEGDNELELLAEFLCACKSSIEDLTSRCETAVHVAVKNHNFEAFKVLFQWLKRVNLTKILNWKDEDGHNVLDIVMSKKLTVLDVSELKKLTEISKLLTRFHITDLLVGYARLQLSSSQGPAKASQPPGFPVSRYLRRELMIFEKFAIWLSLQEESARNMILVVATLITTASYEAALTPPGGYWQDDSSKLPVNSTVVAANSSGTAVEKPHQAGKIIMSGKSLHEFTALNSMIFLASIITVWITAIPLFPYTIPLYMLLWILSSAYFATALIGFPKSEYFAAYLTEYLYMGLLYVVLLVPMLSWLKHYKYKLQLRRDGLGRRVATSLD